MRGCVEFGVRVAGPADAPEACSGVAYMRKLLAQEQAATRIREPLEALSRSSTPGAYLVEKESVRTFRSGAPRSRSWGADGRLHGAMAAVFLRRRGGMSAESVDKLLAASGDLGRVASELEHLNHAFPRRVNTDPERVEKGLAQLVLTLVELLRQLMERQALRRMEAGTLTDEQIERMGDTFMKLEARMQELKAHFELEDRDLNLNLGPLGDLL